MTSHRPSQFVSTHLGDCVSNAVNNGAMLGQTEVHRWHAQGHAMGMVKLGMP